MAENRTNNDIGRDILYPPISPHDSGMLDVSGGHKIYWEESGNPSGPAVIFLHGGPGAGCAPAHRRFFDPAFWRIVLFDQRGCGRSQPSASVANNTTQDIIEDIETIREMLSIERWLVFGGSWGSLLSLAYGIAHPDRCSGFIMRGIFLGQREELRWFMEDMGRFFPDAEKAFLKGIPEKEHDDLMGNYHRRLIDPDPYVHTPAANAWSNYETACARLLPAGSGDTYGALPLAWLEAHYFVNDMFLPANYVMDNLDKINHLPCAIVQGRYDVICPLWSADKLATNWPISQFHIVNDAGHSAFEPGIVRALVKATNAMKVNQ